MSVFIKRSPIPALAKFHDGPSSANESPHIAKMSFVINGSVLTSAMAFLVSFTISLGLFLVGDTENAVIIFIVSCLYAYITISSGRNLTPIHFIRNGVLWLHLASVVFSTGTFANSTSYHIDNTITSELSQTSKEPLITPTSSSSPWTLPTRSQGFATRKDPSMDEFYANVDLTDEIKSLGLQISQSENLLKLMQETPETASMSQLVNILSLSGHQPRRLQGSNKRNLTRSRCIWTASALVLDLVVLFLALIDRVLLRFWLYRDIRYVPDASIEDDMSITVASDDDHDAPM